MRIGSFFSLICMICWSSIAVAQSPSPLKVDKKIPITGNENFDFILTRSAMVGNIPSADSARIEPSRSGAYSFGIGYGVPLGKTLLLKFEPRVTWFKMYYSASQPGKWFPTTAADSTLIYEKQRVSYLEVPVSLKFKLARNGLDRYKLLLEAGFVFGLKFGSTLKTKNYSNPSTKNYILSPKTTVKTDHIDFLSPYRFGPMVRLGTNWLSLYGFYRMSDVFRHVLTDSYHADGAGRYYPTFPRLEVGITVAL